MPGKTPEPEPTDAEVEELLDAPETTEEREALDRVVGDPEEVLRRARERIEKQDR